MNLKTYHAYTMAEALAAVKQDLGADAVIINTRSFKRGGLLGIGRKTIIEVTATTAMSSKASPTAKSPGKPPATPLNGKAARLAYSTSKEAAMSAGEQSPTNLTIDDRQRTRRLAMALAEKHERAKAMHPDSAPPRALPASNGTPGRDVASAVRDASATGISRAPAAAAANQRERSQSSSTALAAKDALVSPASTSTPEAPRRFILVPAEQAEVAIARNGSRTSDALSAPASGLVAAIVSANDAPRTSNTVAKSEGRHPMPLAAPPKSATCEASVERKGPIAIFDPEPAPALPGVDVSNALADSKAMQEELSAIKTMVSQVLQRQTVSTGAAHGTTPTMPKQLFDMYLKLIAQDLSEELADQIVNDVRNDLRGVELEDELLVREAVAKHLCDYIPVAEQAVPQRSPDGRPLTIALVGPTGVGKTTTLAKLAAAFKLRHHRKVGLITSDTYRIAAVDQLRTYANIIGLPLQVALTPEDMRQAVHRLGDCDVILIDTAGRSQNDTSRLEELREFLTAARPHEVHLALSGTAGEKVLLKEAEAFAVVGVDKIVLTKLDEAVSFGMLINAVRRIGKQLSFITTGQEVPDHLEVGRPQRLAELVLGAAVNQ